MWFNNQGNNRVTLPYDPSQWLLQGLVYTWLSFLGFLTLMVSEYNHHRCFSVQPKTSLICQFKCSQSNLTGSLTTNALAQVSIFFIQSGTTEQEASTMSPHLKAGSHWKSSERDHILGWLVDFLTRTPSCFIEPFLLPLFCTCYKPVTSLHLALPNPYFKTQTKPHFINH